MSPVQLAWESNVKSPNDLLNLTASHRQRLGSVKAKQFIHGLLAAIYICVIGGVSAYDSFLTSRYAISLYDLELNPIGRWIMNLDGWKSTGICPDSPPQVEMFLFLKGFGTCVTLSVIVGLIYRFRRIGHAVGTGVTLFQVGLAGYLMAG